MHFFQGGVEIEPAIEGATVGDIHEVGEPVQNLHRVTFTHRGDRFSELFSE